MNILEGFAKNPSLFYSEESENLRHYFQVQKNGITD